LSHEHLADTTLGDHVLLNLTVPGKEDTTKGSNVDNSAPPSIAFSATHTHLLLILALRTNTAQTMPMNKLVNIMDARMTNAMKNTLLDTLPVAEMTRLIVVPQLSRTRICAHEHTASSVKLVRPINQAFEWPKDRKP
jgi:hypothetical protein